MWDQQRPMPMTMLVVGALLAVVCNSRELLRRGAAASGDRVTSCWRTGSAGSPPRLVDAPLAKPCAITLADAAGGIGPPHGTARGAASVSGVVAYECDPGCRLQLILVSGGSVRVENDIPNGTRFSRPCAPGAYVARLRCSDEFTVDLGAFAVADGDVADLGTSSIPRAGRIAVDLASVEQELEADSYLLFPLFDAAGTSRLASGPVILANGSGLSAPLRPGTYVLQMESRDFASRREPVIVESGRTSRLALTVRSGHKLQVEVGGAADRGDRWLRVVVKDSRGAIVHDPGLVLLRKVTSRFTTCLAAGTYEVSAYERSRDDFGECVGGASLTLDKPTQIRVNVK